MVVLQLVLLMAMDEAALLRVPCQQIRSQHWQGQLQLLPVMEWLLLQAEAGPRWLRCWCQASLQTRGEL